VVGLQPDLSLSRRVQLAVAAHIRHMHTRYDLLLRETNWETARKTVEPLCLDVLVKWRGDEETGRDQVDEMLREIVIIDDSDEEDNESEEGSESESEEEEEQSSDGVAEVNIEKPNTPAVLSQKSPAEFQSGQPAKAQAASNQQSTHLISTSNQNKGVASRTRSKTKSKKSKKARRNNRRYQAWQDAVKRRLARPSAPKTPFEQPSRTNVREVDENRRLMQNRSPVGHSNSELYTAPYNNEYQTIYAIDAGRGPSKPMTVSPLFHPIGVYPCSVIERY
jgi:Uncharacterized conserved protein (DUF2293)